MAQAAFLGLVFILGASLGSFVNVVAWRVPLGISLIRPPSTCPSCGAAISGWALTPVLGYMLAGGACRSCKVPISFRYPLVELTAGLIAMAIWLLHSGPGILPPTPDLLVPQVIIPFVLHLSFAMTLLALALIDLDWFLLPNKITLPLALLGLLTSLAAHRATGVTLQDATFGALLGGGIPLVIGLVYGALTGRAGLGGGDWKLLLALGAWLGPSAIPFIFVAAAVQGLLAAVLFRKTFALETPPPLPPAFAAPDEAEPVTPPTAPPTTGPPEPTPFGRLHVPFGPFLVLAALEWLFFSDELVRFTKSALGGR